MERREPEAIKELTTDIITAYSRIRGPLYTSLIRTADAFDALADIDYQLNDVSRYLREIIRTEADEKYFKEFRKYADEIDEKFKPMIRDMIGNIKYIDDYLYVIGDKLNERFKERLSQIL
ncbi:MAG: hypothetical protein QXL14_02625 [Candidatus Aenigmatarchaeota archaeon]